MVENKYIPVKYNDLYYIFDTLNRWIFPCAEKIYNLFRENGYQQILRMYSKGKCDPELMKFIKILIMSKQVGRYHLYSYPTFKRLDLISSLANVSHIVLELTQECNLACVYCCYGNLYKQERKASKANKQDIVGYLQTLLSLKRDNHICKDFRLSFYGGEPLLCMHTIKECVNLVHSMMHNNKVSYGITTNGILLDKYIEYLVANNFHILVSLDGNEKNDQYRIYKNGKESFKDVVANIQKMYSKYPIFFKNNVEFSTVLHGKNNYMDTVSFFSQWDKLPIFSPIRKTGVKKNIKQYQAMWNLYNYSEKEIDKFKKSFPNEYKTLFPAVKGKCHLWLKPSTVLSDSIDELWHDEYNIYPGNNCILFSSKVFITEDGCLYLCEKVSRKFVFGKIKNGKVVIYLKRINQYYAEILQTYMSKCLSCYKCYECSCCFFAEREQIDAGECFCSFEQACCELHEMLDEK